VKFISTGDIMKKSSKGILLMVMLFLMTSMMGCSALNSGKTLDQGTMEGNVYKNEYFGMSVIVPEEWTIASEEEIEELTKSGNEMIAGDDESKKKMLEKAELRTVYLLSATSEEQGIASFMAMAEKLSFLQNVKDGKAYLEAVKENLITLIEEIPYEFKDIYTVEIGGKEFYALETTIDGGIIKLQQTYYARVENKYALAFITTSMNEANDEAMQGIIDSVEFK